MMYVTFPNDEIKRMIKVFFGPTLVKRAFSDFLEIYNILGLKSQKFPQLTGNIMLALCPSENWVTEKLISERGIAI